MAVKNDKQYEALKDKGMSKERAAKIANSPDASSHGGEKSHSGAGHSQSHQGGTTAQHKAAGRKGGKAAHDGVKAIRQHAFGGPEVLRYEDAPRPDPIETEIRVRVGATSVNQVEVKNRAGRGPLTELPFTPGWDVAGVVDELGGRVTRFAVGDEVLGMPWFPREAGTYSEYVTAPARQFVRKPAELTMQEAGALPLVGLTAWQTLVDVADVQPGQRVLVHAASGGVGHLAVQIAKARGAHVIGTAGADSHATLRELGADELIDYRTTRFEDVVSEVDVVLDLVGGDNLLRSITVLRPGGLLIAIPSGTSPEVMDAAKRAGVRATGFIVEPDQVGLDGLVALVESRRLRVIVDCELALEDAPKAHERAEGDHGMGKIVLIP